MFVTSCRRCACLVCGLFLKSLRDPKQPFSAHEKHSKTRETGKRLRTLETFSYLASLLVLLLLLDHDVGGVLALLPLDLAPETGENVEGRKHEHNHSHTLRRGVLRTAGEPAIRIDRRAEKNYATGGPNAPQLATVRYCSPGLVGPAQSRSQSAGGRKGAAEKPHARPRQEMFKDTATGMQAGRSGARQMFERERDDWSSIGLRDHLYGEREMVGVH